MTSRVDTSDALRLNRIATAIVTGNKVVQCTTVVASSAAGDDGGGSGGGGVYKSTALSDGITTSHGQRWPMICGHRGLLLNAPENTLAAFEACLALRVGFEFDVDRTVDGALVCMHDSTVDRTTNGTGVVGELTLAQVQDLDCGSWFDPSFAGQRVPTIAQIFALVAASLRSEPGRAQVILACDIKSNDPTGSLEQELVQLAIAHGVLDQLLFIGRYVHPSTAIMSFLRRSLSHS